APVRYYARRQVPGLRASRTIELARFVYTRGRMGQRHYALVVFGAHTTRPTIVCLHEAAIPAEPGPAWLILARGSELAPHGADLHCATGQAPQQSGISTPQDSFRDLPD